MDCACVGLPSLLTVDFKRSFLSPCPRIVIFRGKVIKVSQSYVVKVHVTVRVHKTEGTIAHTVLRMNNIITSLAKEVMFLVALVCLFVCLFVCLSVDNITQKVMNGLG